MIRMQGIEFRDRDNRNSRRHNWNVISQMACYFFYYRDCIVQCVCFIWEWQTTPFDKAHRPATDEKIERKINMLSWPRVTFVFAEVNKLIAKPISRYNQNIKQRDLVDIALFMHKASHCGIEQLFIWFAGKLEWAKDLVTREILDSDKIIIICLINQASSFTDQINFFSNRKFCWYIIKKYLIFLHQ